MGFGRGGNEPSGFTSDWDFVMSTVPISLSKRYLGILIEPNKWFFWIPLCIWGGIFMSRVFSVVSKMAVPAIAILWLQNSRSVCLNLYFNCL